MEKIYLSDDLIINHENIHDGLLVIAYRLIIFFSILQNYDLKKQEIILCEIELVSMVSKRIPYDFWSHYHNISKKLILQKFVSNIKLSRLDEEPNDILILIIRDMNMTILEERKLIFLSMQKGESCFDCFFINMVYHNYNLQMHWVLLD